MNYNNKKGNTLNNGYTEDKLIKYTKNRKCTRDEFTNSHWDDEKNYVFNIENENYNNFLDVYVNSIEADEKFGELSFMEKPCDIGPLYFDFDIKTEEKKLFTKDDYIKLIRIVNKILETNFVIKNDNVFDSYILKKPTPRPIKGEEYVSDGFHLHYPNLILNKIEKFFIFDKVKNKVLKKGTFEEKKDKFKNDFDDDFFDARIIKTNSWFLYGSGKKINGDVYYYKVKYAFDKSLEPLECNKKNSKHLVKLFSIRNKEHLREITYKKNINNELSEIEQKYIKKKKISTEDFFVKKANNNTTNNVNNNTKAANMYISDDVVEAKKLIKLLKPQRANGHENWINVGWALFNISPTLLNEFIGFSKTCTIKSKYEEGCCEKIWEGCMERGSNDGYNLPSLNKWAKEDNIAGYESYKLEKINKLLDEGDIKTDFDVATIIYEYYKHEFVCSSISKKSWFQFYNHKWNIIEDGYGLSLKISREMPKEFAKLYSLYIIKSTEGQHQEKDAFMKKSKDIHSVILNLKNKTYKDRIISEASYLFYKKNFIRLLNQNPYLIGFNNGTFDLKTSTFRDGQPEDLISKTTGYDYETFDEDNKIVKDIEAFYEKIQPADDVNLLLKCYAASLFEAGNKDQKIALMIGVGSNGKGTWFDLIDGTLGEYYATIASTVFTQKRGSSSNATPELANKFDTRALGFQEIDSDDKFHMGLLKSMTGQDKMEVRPLYGEPFSYVPQYKIFAAMNVEPPIESDDNGTWRRILKIDFPTIFKSNPKKPNERKGDPDIREKLKGWNQAHCWLLLNKYYKIYKKNKGIEKLIPDSVRISIDKYKNDSNIFMEYFSENVTIDDQAKLEKSTIWLLFKEWHVTSYNIKSSASNKKLMSFFEKNGYKIDRGVNGYIYGIKLKENDALEEI
jgi:P4 family phage/plasmid primase-like protien